MSSNIFNLISREFNWPSKLEKNTKVGSVLYTVFSSIHTHLLVTMHNKKTCIDQSHQIWVFVSVDQSHYMNGKKSHTQIFFNQLIKTVFISSGSLLGWTIHGTTNGRSFSFCLSRIYFILKAKFCFFCWLTVISTFNRIGQSLKDSGKTFRLAKNLFLSLITLLNKDTQGSYLETGIIRKLISLAICSFTSVDYH